MLEFMIIFLILAELQIGRAWLLQGNRDKAKAAYDQFLGEWKDADPDISVLKQARTEYANQIMQPR